MGKPSKFFGFGKVRLSGFLVMAMSMCGCGADKALMCNTDPHVGATFPLGCVGDGRSGGLTPSCDKDAYTYFTVVMSFSGLDAVSLSRIADCRLRIANAKGKELAMYYLQEVADVSGTRYGCATGSTRTFMGSLNYSSCVGGDESLTFSLSASTDEGTASVLVASGAAVATASPGNLVNVDLKATTI